jgi:hypothetical protein
VLLLHRKLLAACRLQWLAVLLLLLLLLARPKPDTQ